MVGRQRGVHQSCDGGTSTMRGGVKLQFMTATCSTSHHPGEGEGRHRSRDLMISQAWALSADSSMMYFLRCILPRSGVCPGFWSVLSIIFLFLTNGTVPLAGNCHHRGVWGGVLCADLGCRLLLPIPGLEGTVEICPQAFLCHR